MVRAKIKSSLTIATVQPRFHPVPLPPVLSGTVQPVIAHGGTLTLVQEAAFSDSGLVLGGHLDVGRGQQEHLVRNTFDGAVQAEDETCRKIDEALRIAVSHL